MEFRRLGVASELQLPAYATATAGSDLHLQPIPQLTATPDLLPTERDQGLNLHSRGS